MDDLDRCVRCACLPCTCEKLGPVIEDCSSCAARNNGLHADYCYHVAFAGQFPGDGRPIKGYPNKPKWCPGFIPEDDDYEYA